MTTRIAVWLAVRLRRWADRLDRPVLLPREADPVPLGAVRFQVVRQMAGRGTWTLYDGPLGARARDMFEHVRRHKEGGTMQLVMDGVVRDRYPR
jgi:hypothetical protein